MEVEEGMCQLWDGARGYRYRSEHGAQGHRRCSRGVGIGIASNPQASPAHNDTELSGIVKYRLAAFGHDYADDDHAYTGARGHGERQSSYAIHRDSDTDTRR